MRTKRVRTVTNCTLAREMRSGSAEGRPGMMLFTVLVRTDGLEPRIGASDNGFLYVYNVD